MAYNADTPLPLPGNICEYNPAIHVFISAFSSCFVPLSGVIQRLGSEQIKN